MKKTKHILFQFFILSWLFSALSANASPIAKAGNPTTDSLPSVITRAVFQITDTTARSGGTVLSNGGLTITARGVCWSTSPNPTIADNHTVNGANVGTFFSNMQGLTPGQTYYVRAYATNSAGTAYGEQEQFATTCTPRVIRDTIRISPAQLPYTYDGNHVIGANAQDSSEHTFHYQTIHGCDSVVHVILVFNSIQVTACFQYFWIATGQTYHTSGTYIRHYTDAQGHAYGDTLHLTIITPTVAVDNIPPVTVCENESFTFGASATGSGNVSFDWSGPSDFTGSGSEVGISSAAPEMSGTYTVTATAIEGNCKAVASATVSITVNPLPEVHISGDAFICQYESTTLIASGAESYLWSTGSASVSITESPTVSTTYTVVGTDENQCQNSASIMVTVNELPLIVISGDKKICEGETAQLTATGAQTYVWSTGNTGASINVMPFETTTYTVEGTDENDCSNNASFTVTIQALSDDTVYASACESYYWPISGEEYTASGTYSFSYNNNNCLAFHTLILNITHNELRETTVTKCETYTWNRNGETYTQSGTYTHSYITDLGCNITEVLHLNINPSTHEEETDYGCGHYAWGANGQLYSESGDYVFEYINLFGCPSTKTLHLTIKHGEQDEVTVIEYADKYYWDVNKETYTESGNYEYRYDNGEGCTNTITLHLTLHKQETSSDQCMETGVTQHESCDGDDGVAYILIPYGLNSDDYEILWKLNDGRTSSENIVTGLPHGTYSVKVTSKKCPGKTFFNGAVTINSDNNCNDKMKVTVSGPTNVSVGCNESSTQVSFSASVSGGKPPYEWSGGSSKTVSIGPGKTQVSFTVRDSKGQSASGSLSCCAQKLECSQDPNEIAGPLGYNDSIRYVNATDKMNYSINFENDPDFATAPASRVKVTYDVPANQNIASFRLADFGFGSHIFTVPTNVSSYSQRLDVSDSLGVWVDVTAGIDIMSHQLFWIFQSIDPATGFEPSSSQMGFLPINDSTGRGEGYVNFYILPDGGVQTGDTVGAEALIVFDDNEPIGTNVWRNTFDAVAPTSTLHAELNAQDSLYCTFSFTAQDDQGGSGVRSVETFVSVNNGGYTSIGSCHPDSTLTYALENGLYYQFMSLATDNVGNTEPSKTVADTAVNYNVAPFDLLLNGTVFYEDVPLSTYIGTFITLDNDINQQFVYELVDGEGSADNGLFKIVNNELRTNSLFECSHRADYSIRVKSTDIGGLSIEREFALNEVILHNTPVTYLSENICEGDSYDFHGQQLTESGSYSDTVTSISGCDSVVTLILTVNPVYNISISEEICQGDYFDFNGVLLTESGTYTDTLQSTKGCDSIVTLTLTVNPVYNISLTQEICQGESFDFHGVMLTQSGIYTDTLLTSPRCDSIVTLNLIVNPVYNTPVTAAICDGGSYSFFDTTLTTAGIYTHTLQSVKGCDSVITLTLTVNPTYNFEYELDICEGERLVFDGDTITESGTYTQTVQTVNGCDSITTVVLTVHPIDTTHIAAEICDGGSYTFFGQTLTTAGAYSHTLQSVLGCDSVIALTLTVNPVYNTPTTATICDGGSYDFFGQTLTTAGTYTHTLQSVKGCDSVIALTLTVNPVYNTPQTATICDGDSYDFFGQTLTTAGSYTHTLQTVNGCDSVIALTLTVNPVYNTPVAAAICDGDSYDFFGQTLTTAGSYTHTLQSVNGCDSVIALTLTVNPVYNTPVSAAICDGGSYDFFGQTLTTAGSYTHTLQSVSGCDSVITLTLTVSQGTHNVETETACESFTWHGTTYTTSGVYTYEYTNNDGCASVDTLHLTITPADLAELAETACESFEWNGQTYTTSGDYVQTFTNAAGCDSTVTLHLTVNHGTHNVETETACESYTWHGETYTTSGVYTYAYMNATGCASADTLHLTVNHGSHNVETETACESFTWHGTTYNTSGTYTYAYNNAGGCASVDTLHLTITPAVLAEFTETVCESYEWNGQTFTTSGDYVQTFTNAAGCDSTVTLHLTVNHGTHNVETETACESYTWHGETYTTSGVYTYANNNADGCASVDTLYLTVHYGTHNVETETACESYTWHGETYTTSGTYTYAYNNGDGCESADTLHLTVNYSATSDFSITTEDSCYEWNNVNYCETGDYTQTLQTVDGCDSVVTLHLTITVGIDDHDLSGIEVFPNPTNRILNIKGENMRRIDIYNADGQLVYTKQNDGSGLMQVDVSRFAAGQYFVKVLLGDGRTATRKVIVNRR